MVPSNDNSKPAVPSPAEQPLTTVQRWMQAVILNPDGVDAGLASAAAHEQIPVGPDQVEQVICRSRNLSSIARLSIYADAYYSRLLECLGEEFPVVKQTLGDETFDAFAMEYLQRYPSRSYTLNKLGESFARFLEETRPGTEDEPSAEKLEGLVSEPAGSDGSAASAPAPDWPELLIDLARMEWTFSVVFDGPGVENRSLLETESLADLTSEQLSAARLELAPCVKLLSLRFPLNDYYTACRKGESAPLPVARQTWLAVSRRDYIVRRHELTERQYRLLAALAEGETVGVAIELAAAGLPATAEPAAEPSDAVNSIESLAIALNDWFRQWSVDGFFTRVIVPQ